MRREERGPKPLSWSLRTIASRVVRVDLLGYAAIEAAWPDVTSARASGSTPVRLSGRELVVAVASGAHADRARHDAGEMLVELASLVAEAPTSVRVTVRR